MKLATLGKWKGQPQWTCALCPFTTLSDTHMRSHLVGSHRVIAVNIDIPLVKPEPNTDASATTSSPAEPGDKET